MFYRITRFWPHSLRLVALMLALAGLGVAQEQTPAQETPTPHEGTTPVTQPAAPQQESAAPRATTPAPPSDVVIKNAYLMTVTHGNIKNGSIYIKNGKIAAVGQTVNAPASATVIDAGGRYVTPGIVDSHSHIALDEDVNEATSPITPQMKMMDAFDYTDKAIYRALAGGVTTSLLLHGSANMIGGQAIVIKHKYGLSRDAMLFPGAPRSIKF